MTLVTNKLIGPNTFPKVDVFFCFWGDLETLKDGYWYAEPPFDKQHPGKRHDEHIQAVLDAAEAVDKQS